jgi:hypothetical protein
LLKQKVEKRLIELYRELLEKTIELKSLLGEEVETELLTSNTEKRESIMKEIEEVQVMLQNNEKAFEEVVSIIKNIQNETMQIEFLLTTEIPEKAKQIQQLLFKRKVSKQYHSVGGDNGTRFVDEKG